MTTLRALFKEGKQRLLEAGIEEWELDAWLLLEYAAGCTRNEYYLYPKREVEESRNRCTDPESPSLSTYRKAPLPPESPYPVSESAHAHSPGMDIP